VIDRQGVSVRRGAPNVAYLVRHQYRSRPAELTSRNDPPLRSMTRRDAVFSGAHVSSAVATPRLWATRSPLAQDDVRHPE